MEMKIIDIDEAIDQGHGKQYERLYQLTDYCPPTGLISLEKIYDQVKKDPKRTVVCLKKHFYKKGLSPVQYAIFVNKIVGRDW